MRTPPTVAYFSMEVGLDPNIPTYSGGLGVLAADTIRAAADLHVPMVAVTLLHRQGYLRQRLDASGWQLESPAEWPVPQYLDEAPARASLTLEGRPVSLRGWCRDVTGVDGFTVPVYFLDTDLPENAPWDRSLTNVLYGGDDRYRLCQEAVLGIGGVRFLRALGYTAVGRYHMNEGHSALLGLELLREHAARADRRAISWDDVDAVRRQCVFTTHTPVPAGHDQFPTDLVRAVLGPQEFAPDVDWRQIVCADGRFNMTFMALSLSHYINGVAKRHAEVSRHMYARYVIDAITNGVHAATWVSPPFAALFDRHIPDWRADNFSLRYAHGIPRSDVAAAHQAAKQSLLDHVAQSSGVTLDPGAMTIGFARRATAYKRADLIFHDPDRLRSVARGAGPLQLVFAGKAHPRDVDGKRMIQRIYDAKAALADAVRVVYLQDYDIRLAKLLTAGSDLWLNTPLPPHEASGTSGMKAALNGVPSLSVPDGWWLEGCIEGLTGWSIGNDRNGDATAPGHAPATATADATSLYDKLERVILPAFYGDPDRFADVRLHCISFNGSFFNTHRMVQQYVTKAYFE